MTKSSKQKQREAKEKRKRVRLSRESAQAPAPLAQSSHENETYEHPKRAARQKPAAEGGDGRRRMIGFILLLSSVAFPVFLFIAGMYWQRRDYASIRTAFYWLIPVCVTFGIIVLSGFWYSVVKPAAQRPLPINDQDIIKRAVTPSVAASLTLNKKLVAEEIVEVNLTFLNGGGSTAEKLAGEVGFVYQNKPSKPEATLCATGTTFGPINLLRGAQIPILIRGLTPLPANELVAIEDGREWLFLCGNASYDGLDGNVPIDLCWMYRRETKTFTDCSDLNNPHNRNAPGVVITGAKLREPLAADKKPRTLIYFINTGKERARVIVRDQSVLYAPNTFKGPLEYQPMHNEPAEFELSPTIPYTLDTAWDIIITEAMAKELESDNATIYFYFRTVSQGESVPYCFRYNRATLPDLPLCPASMKVEN